jgi:hypothetical protein
MPDCIFRWVREDPDPTHISVPVYLNEVRKKLLFSMNLPESEGSPTVWYQRGVAVMAWSLN